MTPALTNYVRDVVCRLRQNNCADMRIYIIDNPTFNASCWPNGMVVVHTGLLVRTENEAQLAFVLGHEITHYLMRHVWNGFDKRRETSDIIAFFSLGVAAAGVGIHTNLSGVSSLAQSIAAGEMFAYNRNQEREADAGGFEMAVRAGYDPDQGHVLWSNISDESNARPDHREPNVFLADHPTDAERLHDMTLLANEARGTTQAADLGTDRWKTALALHRAEWLDEELERGSLFESVYLISRLLKGDPQSGELQFYLAEAYRRRNGTGDVQNAISTYRTAIADGGNQAKAYRGLGIAALKSGDNDTARSALNDYLRLAPAADDKAMIQSYLARMP
ncbi:MAG: M48 family metalloprotease [Rhizomicrobium sp.]